MIRVGETVKEERKKKGLTIEQVAKATKIRASFLLAIEDGEYEKLPGSSYAHGFVKNYLEFLDMPLTEYMARFRREYDEKENRKLMPEGLMGSKGISLRRFSMLQALWIGGIVLLVLCAYLLFQYRAAFLSPSLTILSPLENATVASQVVMVAGTTDQNTAVMVNALPAYVDQNGKFTKELPVFPGSVTLTIKAINSFGKITTVERHVHIKVE